MVLNSVRLKPASAEVESQIILDHGVGLKNGLGALLQQTNSSLPPRVWYNSKGIDALFQKI